MSSRPTTSAGARAERLPDVPSQRASLFGSSLGAAPTLRAGAGGGSAMAAALEEDNDRLTADLEAKVSAVKHAAQAIHDEVSDHNRLLGSMGADFDRTSGLMSGALRGIDGLLRGGARQGHMCYLISFALCIFLLLWWMMGKR